MIEPLLWSNILMALSTNHIEARWCTISSHHCSSSHPGLICQRCHKTSLTNRAGVTRLAFVVYKNLRVQRFCVLSEVHKPSQVSRRSEKQFTLEK